MARILARFFAQNGRAVPAVAECEAFAARLAAVVAERGLPRLLAPGECGVAGSLPDEVCAPLVARVVAGASEPLLADAARQLVKACFHPAFTECRDSFREVARDGTCRRQDLARVRGRVSGTHCVDCPHWVALTPAEHERFVADEWKAGATEFATHRDVYLPEDFRALRRWLQAAAREGQS